MNLGKLEENKYVKSSDDFKLYKEWISSEAYLYQTFEDYKRKINNGK